MKVAISLILIASCGMAYSQSCCETKEKKSTKVMVLQDGKDACCKSTEAKPVAKGEKGCCNAAGAPAKYKVWVYNEGYRYFGCEGSAKEGAKELVTWGYKIGNVQKVVAKKAI